MAESLTLLAGAYASEATLDAMRAELARTRKQPAGPGGHFPASAAGSAALPSRRGAGSSRVRLVFCCVFLLLKTSDCLTRFVLGSLRIRFSATRATTAAATAPRTAARAPTSCVMCVCVFYCCFQNVIDKIFAGV